MKRTYLLAYNLLLALGWLVFLVYQLSHGFQLDTFSLWLLNICQVAALLEVLHAATGWVRTPVFTTFIQVASRVFVLFFINYIPMQESILAVDMMYGIGVGMVSVAWGITEVVRYSFYFLGMLNKEVAALTWMRYSFFLVLYPLGVTGEFFVMATQLRIDDWGLSLINLVLYAVMLSYIPFFPQLFGYMLKQRKKKLG